MPCINNKFFGFRFSLSIFGPRKHKQPHTPQEVYPKKKQNQQKKSENAEAMANRNPETETETETRTAVGRTNMKLGQLYIAMLAP